MSWFPGTYPFEGIPYSLVDDHEACKRQLDNVNEDRAGLQTRLARALRDADHLLAEKTKLKQDHDSLQADHDALKKSHSSLAEQVKKLSATVSDLRENSVPERDYYKAISEVQSNFQTAVAHEKTAKSYAATITKLEKEVEGLKAKAVAVAHTEQQLRTRLAASRSEHEQVNLKLQSEARKANARLLADRAQIAQLKETSEKNAAMFKDADEKLKAAQSKLMEKAAQWHREKLDLIHESKQLEEKFEMEKMIQPEEELRLEKAHQEALNLLQKYMDECVRLAGERDEKARLCDQLADSYQQEMLQQRDAQEKLRQEYLHQVELLAIAKDQNDKLLASWNAAKEKYENEKEEQGDNIGYLKRQVEYYEGEYVPALEGKVETFQQGNNDLRAQYSTLKAQYPDLKAQNSDLKAKYSDLHVQYSGLNARYCDLKAQYSNARDTIASTKVANDEMKKRCDALQADLDKTREQYQVLEASQVQKCRVIEETKRSLAEEVEQGKQLAAQNKLYVEFIADTFPKEEEMNEKYLSVCEENESSRKEHMLSLAELETERNRVRLLQARLEEEKAKYTEQIHQLRNACEYLEAQNEDLIREMEGFDHVGQFEGEDDFEEDYSAEGAWQLRDHEEEEDEQEEEQEEEFESIEPVSESVTDSSMLSEISEPETVPESEDFSGLKIGEPDFVTFEFDDAKLEGAESEWVEEEYGPYQDDGFW